MVTNRKEQVKELWQICFNDTEDFIRLFFNSIYKDANAVTIERDGQVVSALHLLPYSMLFCGEEIPVAYIYAVCTHPDQRGQGLMKQLIEKAITVLQERDVPLAVLIPASQSLFELYRRDGFTEIAAYSTQTYEAKPSALLLKDNQYVVLSPDPADFWFDFFDRKQRERKFYVLHSNSDFQFILRDTLHNDGQVIGLTNETADPLALAFVVFSENKAVIQELFCVNEKIKELFIQEIIRRNHLTEVTVKIPPCLPQSKRFGMGFITQPDKLIPLWSKANHPNDETAEKVAQMDIPALTSFLFDYPNRKFFMSLMFD